MHDGVGLCIHHTDFDGVTDFKPTRLPERDYVFVAANVPDADTLLDGLDLPENPPRYAFVRGPEYGWIVTDRLAPELIAWIVREELRRGEETGVFLTDDFDAGKHYLLTGDDGSGSLVLREEMLAADRAMGLAVGRAFAAALFGAMVFNPAPS